MHDMIVEPFVRCISSAVLSNLHKLGKHAHRHSPCAGERRIDTKLPGQCPIIDCPSHKRKVKLSTVTLRLLISQSG